MEFDYELEDILYSMKEKDENGKDDEKQRVEYAKPLEPPKPRMSEAQKPPEPTKVEKSSFDLSAVKGKLNETKESLKRKNESSEKVKLSFKLPEPVEKALNKVTEAIKKIPLKKAAVALGAVVVAFALIFGGIRLVNYAKGAYIRKYEKKYNITFPVGIRKDFCDEYGKNQSYAGRLYIEDTETDKAVYSSGVKENAVLLKGSTVLEAQEVRSIALDKSYADLERIYSTPEGFKKASQKVTFNTLFEEENYRVIAAFYTNTKAEDDDEYIFPYCAFGNMTEKSFKGFEDRIKSRRLYDTGFQLLYEHRILTLSVPSDFMPNFKFVVVCVKTKSSFKRSSTATPNETIHYPQVWYDKNNEKNPYYLAGKWYPEIITDAEKGTTKKLTMNDFDFS